MHRTETNRSRAWLAALLSTFFVLPMASAAAADDWFGGKGRRHNIIERLEKAGDFTILLTALRETGLDELFEGEGPLTLLAPTDEAFAPLVEAGVIDDLLADEEGKETLSKILAYHAIDGKKRALRLLFKKKVPTLLGPEVVFSLSRKGFRANDERVIDANNKASNGIIHVLDGVLIPPGEPGDLIDVLEEDGRFTVLLTALRETGLDELLEGEGPFTVFAPTDEAFAPLLEDGTIAALLAEEDQTTLKQILAYHVTGGDLTLAELLDQRVVDTALMGESVLVRRFFFFAFIDRSLVIDRDLDASNGKIQVINQVLNPAN